MTAPADDTPDKDQSMDDILASIRRIMLDEQARLQDSPGAVTYETGRAAGAGTHPVLILDSSMVVEPSPEDGYGTSPLEETVIVGPSKPTELPPARAELDKPLASTEPPGTGTAPPGAMKPDAVEPVRRETAPSAQPTVLGATEAGSASQDPSARQVVISAQALEALMAPTAAAAAVASVEALLKQLGEERLAALRPLPPSAAPPSPSLEEVVRSELRPYLKAWLDEHMPPMVERLVRAEITRLIGRSGF
jgi:cell pole-organizing protein PopZ